VDPLRSYTTASGEVIGRTWPNFEKGLIPIEELDDQELSREQLRDRHGTFTGSPGQKVPRKLRNAIGAEIQRRYQLKYQMALSSAQDTVIDIMDDPTATAGERFRAAVYVQERVVGKMPDKVEVTAEVKPWQALVEGIVHDIEASEDGEIAVTAVDPEDTVS
jgi:hypothetical protein